MKKLENIKYIGGSAVSNTTEIILSLEEKDANELRKALAVIDYYKKDAIKYFIQNRRYDPKNSDWMEYSYCVKNDKVIITIKDGMAG